MNKSILALATEFHPCKKQWSMSTVEPECLTDKFGKCDVYENAIFCPKYGKMLGVFKNHEMLYVEVNNE